MKLNKIRKTKMISQKDLAQAVGVTVPAVSSWEKGRYKPRLENLKRAASFLGCTIDELLEDEKRE